MLITEKDLNLNLRYSDLSLFENILDNLLFIIPKFEDDDSRFYLMPNKTDYASKKIDKDLKDYFSEFIAPNYIDLVRIKDDSKTPVYAERFDVIFDLDEEIAFYFKLKFIK